MGEVIYPGSEPEFDPDEADMAAYEFAKATFQLSADDWSAWDRLDRVEKLRLVREARERLAAGKVVKFPLTHTHSEPTG